MGESTRFDPAGWFLSVCLTLLVAVISLVVAVELLRAIWAWLVAGIVLALLGAVGVRLALWWRRRRLW